MDTMVWWGDDQYALSGIVVLGKVHQEATGAIPSFLTKSIEIMRQKENKYGKKNTLLGLLPALHTSLTLSLSLLFSRGAHLSKSCLARAGPFISSIAVVVVVLIAFRTPNPIFF
jgi:hypothetical protein